LWDRSRPCEAWQAQSLPSPGMVTKRNYFDLQLINLCAFGTPRGVYISVGVSPTRQLTIRTVTNEIVILRINFLPDFFFYKKNYFALDFLLSIL